MATKVLIIDDDRDFRTSVRSLLETQGYSVVEAESGKQGLRLLSEQQPDVILLDILMECDCAGYGVNQAIKFQDEYAAYRDVPIIMVSSIEETPDELFARCSEVDMIRPDRYLTKPLDIPKFLKVLESVAPCRSGTTAH